KLLNPPHPQYRAEGVLSLFDGIPPDPDWRKGNWIGIQDKDLVVELDLGEACESSTVCLTCLQDSKSWILFPRSVEVLLSRDGINFVRAGHVMNDVPPVDETIQVRLFEVKINRGGGYRYMKIVARNFGDLPEWHAGKGGKAYIFAAELD